MPFVVFLVRELLRHCLGANSFAGNCDVCFLFLDRVEYGVTWYHKFKVYLKVVDWYSHFSLNLSRPWITLISCFMILRNYYPRQSWLYWPFLNFVIICVWVKHWSRFCLFSFFSFKQSWLNRSFLTYIFYGCG